MGFPFDREGRGGYETGPSSGPMSPPSIPAAAAVADPGLLTLERIFGEPKEFRSERWNPSHWLKDGEGFTTLEASEEFKAHPKSDDIKDIIRYDAATGRREVLVPARALVPEGQDTPLQIEKYAWTQDNEHLLIFTNAQKVWREKTRGDYWILHLQTGRLRQLGGSVEPASLLFATLSPDSTRVAYVHRNNIYVQSLADLSITPLTTDGGPHTINGTADWVNEEEFHLRNGIRWSPDSCRLAYWQFDTTAVSEFPLINNTDGLYPQITTFAYPKVGLTNSACRVGVVEATGGPTRWFNANPDPRNHYIPRMEWTPDNRRVLFQQLNRLQNTNHVISADPVTAATEVLFTDQDEAWVDVMDEMTWIDAGARFLWLSERDGWRHAYAVCARTGDARLLTPGDYDVIALSGVDEANGYLYFIASPHDATKRFLHRVPLDGSGHLDCFTPSDQRGAHAYHCNPQARWAFRTHSRFGRPPVVDLVRLPEHDVVATLGEGNAALCAKLDALAPVRTEFFRIPIPGGPELDAWCILPPDFDPAKRYPLLVHVYGEPAAVMVVDRWMGDNYLWHAMLAQQGYVVACIDNRGTPSPRGRAWRKSIYRQIGILAPADQAAAVRELLRSRPYLDPARVGVWGHSGGGSMSLHAIFRYPELYRVAMALAFVADQRLYDTIYQERYMGLPADNPEGFRDGSPVTHAAGLQGKLLIAYGTGDDNCHYQNCEVLVNELVRLNKPFAQVSYPNRSHALDEGPNTKLHLYSTMTRFLHEHLPLNPVR
jgi:dipeptidyl-peptidase-4